MLFYSQLFTIVHIHTLFMLVWLFTNSTLTCIWEDNSSPICSGQTYDSACTCSHLPRNKIWLKYATKY